MTPYLLDPDFTLYQGGALEVLRALPDGSVQCCVTSPPYWGLRDYGADGQLGLEATPKAYVAALVAVFAEVRRVLTNDGTLWLNLGDSYSSGAAQPIRSERRVSLSSGLKAKDLVGIPWRVAFALQADGWYLRSDIIWSKPNPMPESVTDRPTKAHEYVFLLSKSPQYWFDAYAIAEPAIEGTDLGLLRGRHAGGPTSALVAWHADSIRKRQEEGVSSRNGNPSGMRNSRSVWEIATHPYSEAHFAVFPQELARRAILAGCPEQVCQTCGKSRERILERHSMVIDRSERTHELGHTRSSGTMLEAPSSRTTGWTDCGHGNYQSGKVLDPFLGSGTTALVARKHGRHSVGIELNPDYCVLAGRRLQQLSLLADPAA